MRILSADFQRQKKTIMATKYSGFGVKAPGDITSTNDFWEIGKDAELNNMEMYGTTMPLYMGFWTSNDNVNSTITSRSNDIDLNKKDTLQIDEICRIITI